MDCIVVEKLNEATIRVYSPNDIGIDHEINAAFTFAVPGAKFMPAYRARKWDGKARLYNLSQHTMAFGLLPELLSFARKRDYAVELAADVRASWGETTKVDESALRAWIDALHLHQRNGTQRISLRDYQIDAICRAIEHGRLLLLSPTASGKSAIIYALVRWHRAHDRRVLLLVPSTSLVEQMYSDFVQYAYEDATYSVADDVRKLYSGMPRDDVYECGVLISTWQTVHAMLRRRSMEVKQFMLSWQVLIGDEAHRFTAHSLVKISEQLHNARWRIGTTGTLNDNELDRLQLQGTFGPVHRVITTRDLMEAGQVAPLKIRALVLKHHPIAFQQYMAMHGKNWRRHQKIDYDVEIDYIVTNRARNALIAKLAHASSGNTIVLFSYVEKHGKALRECIEQLGRQTGRPVYYIDGEVDVKQREQIRALFETHDDAILVASYGTLSTGVNIPSIANIIFASPSKSKIRNLQSIGRGLRLSKNKDKCLLIDICDHIDGVKPNYAKLHFSERMQQYQSEGFEWETRVIDLQ